MTFGYTCFKDRADGRWCLSLHTASGVHVIRRRGKRIQAIDAAMRRILRRLQGQRC